MSKVRALFEALADVVIEGATSELRRPDRWMWNPRLGKAYRRRPPNLASARAQKNRTTLPATANEWCGHCGHPLTECEC